MKKNPVDYILLNLITVFFSSALCINRLSYSSTRFLDSGSIGFHSKPHFEYDELWIIK